jgi:hypothetical protein
MKRQEVGENCIMRSFTFVIDKLYSSQNDIWTTTSRRMRWARHVARMGEIMNAYKILVENTEGKNHSKGPGVDGRIILKWVLMK